MTSKELTRNNKRTLGDAAVDGLLYGILAGLVMAAFLVAAGLAAGDGVDVTLALFGPGEAVSAFSGALLHLAVSAVYGILFGLGWRSFARPDQPVLLGLLGGLAYGMVLLVVARLVLPATNSPLQEIAAVPFAIAHLIFGACLGFLFARGN